jgi:Ser/Thr protein kinase RdoA (MazF antagonist)
MFTHPAHVVIPEAFGLHALDSGQPVTKRVSRWKTDGGEVAVKTFDASEQARGATEADLIAFLAAQPDPAYRTQVPFLTAAGAPWVDHEGQRTIVTRWEAGAYRSYDSYSVPEWASLGRCLAALHLRLDDMTMAPLDTLSSRLHRIDAGAELARLAADGLQLPQERMQHPDIGVEQLDRYRAARRDLFTACYSGALRNFPIDDPQRPIHNDFNQFNYLFSAARPPLILDWEASIGAPREFEVVRCLNHLPLQSPALATSFLCGYLGVRSLRAERMRWAVDVSCLMHATKHWVLQGWLDRRPGFEERLRGAMEMVTIMARGRTGLADFFTLHVEDAS